MFSSTLKRSAATLGVVAGLLAAAVPASAIADLRPNTPQRSGLVSRPDQTAPRGTPVGSEGVKAPHADSSEVAMESVTQTRNLNDVDAIDVNALGTQIGALGIVKSFDSEKGSGFIVPDNGPDVELHSSALKTAGLTRVEAGQRVAFKVTQGPRGPQAEDVRLAGTQIGSEG